jgi:hypothetical protein
MLPKFFQGDTKPATATEGLELASLCRLPCKRLHATAARLAADAFAADAVLAADLQKEHRYNAACSAALAAAGQADDARLLPDRVTLALRRQALAWLQADLALYAQLLQRDPNAKAAVKQQMTHWQQDTDLASARGQEALDRLPGDGRAAWRRLWNDVDALRKQAEEEN